MKLHKKKLSSKIEGITKKSVLKSLMIAGISMPVMNPAMANANEEASAILKLEEIIVTARKREESIQEVPISITAFSEKDIADSGVLDVRQLAESVPNVVFTGIDNSSVTIFTVRGVQTQSRANIGFESGVGTYVDGVVMGRALTSANQDFFDVERVEFLRGPQGTLFGKNSIAGAINITTKRPTEEFTGSVGVSLSDYDGYQTQMYLSGPLVEGALYGSVSAYKRKRDGYIENITTGDEDANEDVSGGRIKLLYTPTDNLEITLAADTQTGDAIVASPQAISGYGFAPGEYKTSVDLPSSGARTNDGASLTVNWDVSGGTLTSISAYRESSRNRTNDTDVGPLPAIATFVDDNQHQVSQEVRFSSEVGDTFRYVVGAYYFEQDNYSTLTSNVDFFGFLLSPNLNGTIESESRAVFFNADWDFAEDWTLTFGARYNEEDKDLDYEQTTLGLLAPTLPSEKDQFSDSDFSPTLGISYNLSNDVNLYAIASRGYKSGGWNVDSVADFSVTSFSQLLFDSESVTNYEFGIKSSWLKDRVIANASVFLMDYEDMQVSKRVEVLGGGGAVVGITTNAGKAETKGIEFDLKALVTEGLQISAGVGYVSATYTDYEDSGDSFNGNSLDNAPRWTANASAQYLFPIGELIGIARLDYSYRSDYFIARENTSDQEVEGWDLFNAKVGVRSPDNGWEVSLSAKNLLDDTYIVGSGPGGFVPLTPSASETVSYGAPRLVSLNLKYDF